MQVHRSLQAPFRIAILLLLPIVALISARRTSAQPARPPRPLDVSFVCNACGLDTDDVRKAVLAETGATAGSFAQGAAQLSLRVDKRHLTARYETPDRRVLERQLDLPKDPSRAVQAIALLAANLARDEAADLLDRLRPPAPPSASSPTVASSAASPSSASRSSASPSTSSSASSAPAIATSPSAARSASMPAPHSSSIPPLPVETPRSSAPLDTQAINVSLWHPIALYPSSDRRAFHFELGLLYGKVHEIRGGLLGFGVTDVQGNLDGVALTGVGSVATRTRGLMFAMIGNATRTSMSGVQLAGFMNGAGQGSGGVQLASANLAFYGYDGLQLGLINYATGPYRGAQIGLLNIAGAVRGTQIGFVNVADEMKGFPVGPLNFNRTGRMQILTWGSTTMLGNFGLRYLHRYLYTLLAAGWQPAESSLGGSGYRKVAWQIGVGGHIPIKSLFVDADLGYVHEGAASQDAGIGHTQVFRYRAMVGWQPLPLLGFFAGGAIRHEYPAEGSSKTRPEALFGIQFF